jgi:hypothetical protein
MRRVFLYLFVIGIIWIVQLNGQEQDVTLLGRWGKGSCEAVFERGGYIFIGDGGYLVVYGKQSGQYQKLDEILLNSTIRDIWVKRDTSEVYVACGRSGVEIIGFDVNHPDNKYFRKMGAVDTPGYASGLMHWGNYVYVADGNNGLVILEPNDLILRGTYHTVGFAHKVWGVNDSTFLVAADTSGLYSIRIRNRNPSQLLKLSVSESCLGHWSFGLCGSGMGRYEYCRCFRSFRSSDYRNMDISGYSR